MGRSVVRDGLSILEVRCLNAGQSVGMLFFSLSDSVRFVTELAFAGFVAALAASEASRRCNWASRSAAVMWRVRSVIDWRSSQHGRSELLT